MCALQGLRLQHGEVRQREVAEAGDVKEGDLVGALRKVALRQLHRRAQVAHLRDKRDMSSLLRTMSQELPVLWQREEQVSDLVSGFAAVVLPSIFLPQPLLGLPLYLLLLHHPAVLSSNT